MHMAEIPLSDEDDEIQAALRREYLRQNPPIAKPIGSFYCWGCGARMISIAEGQSLAANETLYVCNRYWETLPIVERIQLGYLFRSSSVGGLGAGEAIAKIAKLADFLVDKDSAILQQALDAAELDELRERLQDYEWGDDDSEAWKRGVAVPSTPTTSGCRPPPLSCPPRLKNTLVVGCDGGMSA